MKRRMTLVLVTLALAAIAFPSAAAAWSDSSVDSLNDRYWGTHDWVMYQAYVAAGKPAWFDFDAAVLAADDPDRDGSSKALHVFHTSSSYGGAPHMVSDLYSQAIASYQAGDYKAASRAMGLLSHYYADACTPFHTAGPTVRKAYASYHRDYENAVKTASHLKSDKAFLKLRDRKAVRSVRGKTINSAYVAKRQLDTICNSWPNGGISNSTVRAATKVSLSEAVNGLADIIVAVPAGKGRGPQPNKFSAFKPYRRYVAKYKSACAVARVVDSEGNPMRGVLVTFTWQLARGKTTDVGYTDKNGYATSWKATGSQPWYKRFYANARVDTFGATLTSKQTWFMTTPRLARGKAGFASSMSNRYPTRGSYVTAKAKAVSTSGKPVPNLRVKFVWKHSSRKIVTYATTNSKGIARSKRYIGSVKRGYKVYVVATTQAAGVNRQWTTNFTPK